MLHAAFMFFVLFGLWLLAIEPGAAVHNLWIAGASAALCTGLAARFGGVGSAFTGLPRGLAALAAESGAIAADVIKTMRAALSADVALRPALMRVKTRIGDAEKGAALASMISARPGMVAVEADADGVLVHVLDEGAAHGARFARFEQRAKQLTDEA